MGHVKPWRCAQQRAGGPRNGYTTPSDLTHPPPGPEVATIARLTAREREVMPRIGAGLLHKAIAARLGVTEAGVRSQLTAIYGK